MWNVEGWPFESTTSFPPNTTSNSINVSQTVRLANFSLMDSHIWFTNELPYGNWKVTVAVWGEKMVAADVPLIYGMNMFAVHSCVWVWARPSQSVACNFVEMEVNGSILIHKNLQRNSSHEFFYSIQSRLALGHLNNPPLQRMRHMQQYE